MSGSSPERKRSSFRESSLFSLRHERSASACEAAHSVSSARRSAKTSRLSSKTAKGCSGSPPRCLTVAAKSAPAAERGCPCVETRSSKLLPSAATAPLPITVRPMMSVGRSVSELAATSASRISLMLLPSMVSTFQPHASYFIATFSVSTSSTLVESCTLLAS